MLASLHSRIRFAAVALVIAAAMAVFWVLDEHRHQAALDYWASDMGDALERSELRVQQLTRTLSADVLFLAQTPPVAGIVRAAGHGGVDPRRRTRRADWEGHLRDTFVAFLRSHPDYYMARLIGVADGGRELVRVQRRQSEVTVTPADQLQPKGDRDFVGETVKLTDGKVFLSDLDLERDGATGFWRPHRPTLRAATPVRGEDGRVFGVVVLNLDGNALLAAVRDWPADVEAATSAYLTDDRWHYLMHPDPERAFTFATGDTHRMSDDLPALFARVQASGDDHVNFAFVSEPGWRGYAAAVRIRFDARRPERFLLLASLLPEARVHDILAPQRREMVVGAVAMVAATLGVMLLVLRVLLRPLEQLTAAARLIAKGGREVSLPCSGSGGIGQLVAAFRKMRDQIAARERELRRLNANLEDKVRERAGKLRLAASVFDNTSEGVLVADENSNIISVNQAFTDITGYQALEAVGEKTSLLKSDRHDAAFYRDMWATLLERGRWQGEIWNRRKNGEAYLEWLTINRIPAEHDFPVNYVAVFHDITEQRRKDERIRHLAFHDALTGLPNRALFQDRLQHAVARAQREGSRLSVTFIDLDGFKAVNDGLGHDVGDLLLMEVADRIRSRLRRDVDTVARLGGDEFVVLMEDLRDADACACLAGEIIADIARPMELKGHTVRVGASMGMAFFPDDGRDALELMKRADTAMYAAKAAGKGTYRFYRDGMLKEVADRLTLESSLRQAVEKGELTLHYQPKICITDDCLRGVEALVRWRHPERGLVPPDEFIPLAEETGIILALGEWVLETACRQAAAWMERGLSVPIAVNVSARQLAQGQLADRLDEMLDRYGLPAAAIQIELTETALMADPEVAARTLDRMRELGIAIAVDDFGTGYSSLSRLRRLPIDLLKIDRSFVANAHVDEKDAQVVRTVIALARTLGMDVVAEGVESAPQAELLRRAGCTVCQGYYYGRPAAPEELESLLVRKP